MIYQEPTTRPVLNVVDELAKHLQSAVQLSNELQGVLSTSDAGALQGITQRLQNKLEKLQALMNSAPAKSND